SPTPVEITDSASSAMTKTMPAIQAYRSRALVVRVSTAVLMRDPRFGCRPRAQPNHSRRFRDEIEASEPRVRGAHPLRRMRGGHRKTCLYRETGLGSVHARPGV